MFEPLAVLPELASVIVVADAASHVPASSASVVMSATSPLAARISGTVAPVVALMTALVMVVQAVSLDELLEVLELELLVVEVELVDVVGALAEVACVAAAQPVNSVVAATMASSPWRIEGRFIGISSGGPRGLGLVGSFVR